jgi:diaminopimelate decarboxylase
VISSYELWLALRLGVPPERIIYNGPLKSEESVREALARNIALITANHPEEIPYLADIASSMGARARMGIRVSIEDGWSGQFGVPMGEAALEAFSLARSLHSLDVRALHVHRGGMIRTAHELRTMVRAALAFSDQLAARLGIELSIIDFGGSLCTPSVDHVSSIDYRLNRALHRQVPPPDVAGALTIESHCSIIRTMVAEHFGRAGRQCPRIFLEPGRALTGNTQMLLTRVHALKHAPDRTYAILDGGINIAEPVRSEYHQLFSVNRPTEPHDTIHTLVGPICTPADTLYPSVRLPRLQVGDSLAIMDAGAYFVPFATSFSFPQPAIVAVDGSTDYIVRRAETFEDMNARDGLPVHAEPTPAARC